jgi:hypothetical protein
MSSRTPLGELAVFDFYTLSKEPLSLPESTEVVDAQAFSFY